MVFFKDKAFVNSQDHETGNSALHLASRQGNFVSPADMRGAYVCTVTCNGIGDCFSPAGEWC